MLSRFFFSLALLLALASPAIAAETARHSTARLFTAVQGVDELKTVPAGVELKLDKGWKTYWRTPGEAGLAPVFNWSGSSNLKSATVLWPAPHRFTAFDIDNYGYKGALVFPLEITPEEIGKPVDLKLKLDILICEELCIPESHTLSLSIPATAALVTEDQAVREEAVKKVPTASGTERFSVENVWIDSDDGKGIILHALARAENAPSKDADFFVESAAAVSIGAPLFDYTPSTKALRIDAPVRANETLDSIKKSLGASALTLTFVDGADAFERTATLSGAAAATPIKTMINETREQIDLPILLMAFIGGLILNLMPCMLPVLSIKILSVLNHGGKDHRIHRWPIFRDFMTSAAGIIFSFWVLAGALIALKGAGATIGWGIQFQQPIFLVFMILVLLGFAANMWGVFEIPLPRFIARNLPVKHAQEPTLLGHFLTGAFATLLATPCTAPFLGTVVGFALAREAFDILLVFTFLGIGLAFPYIVLALSPRLFKHMPKPGAWMNKLKKVLSVAVALTAVWLMHVLVTATTQPTLDSGWTKFDEALIQPAVKDGQTVMVDVTADWCLTCKANKRLVLEQDDVEAALSEPNVLRLQADWTQRDETIAAYLRKYGRYGIPFNIVYGPGAPEGIILSELLTKKDVMNALKEAAGE